MFKGIIGLTIFKFRGIGRGAPQFLCYIWYWILRFFRLIFTWPTLIGAVFFCWHFLVWLGILFDLIAGMQHFYGIGCIGIVVASRTKIRWFFAIDKYCVLFWRRGFFMELHSTWCSIQNYHTYFNKKFSWEFDPGWQKIKVRSGSV